MGILLYVANLCGSSHFPGRRSPLTGFWKRLFGKKIACLAAVPLLVAFPSILEGSEVSAEPSSKPIVVHPIVVEKTVQKTPDGKKTQKPQKPKPLFRHGSYPTAWKAAQQSNRPILIFVSMPNCPHCVKMIDQTYHRPEVEQVVRGSFETVYAGRQSHAQLVRRLQIKWYPTTILVSPSNKVLDKIEGYVDAKSFGRRLRTGIAAVKRSSPTKVALAPASSR